MASPNPLFLHHHHHLLLLLLLLFINSATSSVSSVPSTKCSTYTFPHNTTFPSCTDLPYLNSFLHWDYNPSTGILRIAYRHSSIPSPASTWVAWAINPSSPAMIGSQALVAFHRPSDGKLTAYTAPVNDYSTSLTEAKLSIDVRDVEATYSDGEITIFGYIQLKENTTTLNHVWQDGPVSPDGPVQHSTNGDNVKAAGILNLLSGQSGIARGGGDRIKKRNVGIRNLDVLQLSGVFFS